MNFSIGLLDSLFGDWVTLRVPGPNGEIIRREVTKKWLKKMEAENRFSQVNDEVVHVRILDPAGEIFHTWTIGKDVEPEIVEQWADKKSNTIYMINGYKSSEVDSYFVSKDIWEELKRDFDSV